MSTTSERQHKEQFINAAASSLAANEQKTAKPQLDRIAKFVRSFYELVPYDDLATYDDAGLAAAAGRSMFSLIEERKPGTCNIRVFNPDLKRDGWHVPRTVIQTINDDMPFILDSIAAEINRNGLTIAHLFHPIMKVARSEKGEFKGVDTESKDSLVESCIHIELEQLVSPAVCKTLEESLAGVLQDVRWATGDWKKIRARLADTIAEIEKLPKSAVSADTKEDRAFLQYLHDNNFTLLGCRDYDIADKNGVMSVKVKSGSGMGILRDQDRLDFFSGKAPPEAAALERVDGALLVSKLYDYYSTVHRHAPLDMIAVKRFDDKGKLVGQRLIVGLFTSATYSRRAEDVPLLRRKIAEVIANAGFAKDSHDGKALEHVLEKYPRDELFQISPEKLLASSLGILRLQKRQRVALFTRVDPLERYVSCLVYVPRDRFDTRFRRQIQKLLEREIGGKCQNYYTTQDDSPLARVLIIVKTPPGERIKFDRAQVEERLIEIGQEWPERLKSGLLETMDQNRGLELAYKYAEAFSPAYQERTPINGAVVDIEQIERVLEGWNEIGLDLYQPYDVDEKTICLKIYHRNTPVPLSDVLPILENMGVRVKSEMPYEVLPSGMDVRMWIHDFVMQPCHEGDFHVAEVKENFEDVLRHAWLGKIENDALNALALTAQLSYAEIEVLRAYTGFLKQARYTYSRSFIHSTLNQYPHISRLIIDLFKVTHDPQARENAARERQEITDEILHHLESVDKLDQDRVLRSFLSLVNKTLRTNYFQKEGNGARKPWLSFKLDSRDIKELPLPRPNVEIYVYSARMEAVHLRGGRIARGGIRWSDRNEDFRTEVLGLVKSQMVKNAVIVPVGAKGGFILKNPPTEGGRKALQEEGIACYRMMIQALLDITDNRVKTAIVRPKDVVCHDDEDPYLVVAADKGTATFSDIANELSVKAGFWLDDAFASGGSAGYDHKIMGITAKGAWESVKRHFRELGHDIQKDPFSVIGVGDMGGDVFGNGMLLSEHIRLIGAFNHVHIFCDPDPDCAESFKERQRLFNEVKGWDQYDTKKLSKGGRVYERSAKSLKLTPEIQRCFGIEADTIAPSDLILTMLRFKSDLLWFGGIGTFVKASHESHADANDRANDALRIDARELNARVVGEGANLGFTQKARVEYARRGGKINTDFIDNSGGVDCSDHEVNIKILLTAVAEEGSLERPQRDKLLKEMTDDVADLVLRDNYQQTQGLSMAEYRGPKEIQLQARFVRDLEKTGKIDRQLEGLPDDEVVDRLARDGKGFTRPELSILLAYAKMTFKEELLASRVPDDDGAEAWLTGYFPPVLQERFGKQIRGHRLKREIISTHIANTLVNRMGPVFVKSRMDKAGVSASKVGRGFVIMSAALGMPELWSEIEALDNKVPGPSQIEALNETTLLLKRTITWLLRKSRDLNIAVETKRYRDGIARIEKNLEKIVPPTVGDQIHTRTAEWVGKGLPEKLSRKLAILPVLSSACDIILISENCEGDISAIAETYFAVGDILRLAEMRGHAFRLATDDHWQARSLSGLIDDFYASQASLAARIIAEIGCSKAGAKAVEKWLEDKAEAVEKLDQLYKEIGTAAGVNIAMMTLYEQRVRHLI